MTLQVLVIDDDQVDREAVRRYLSRPGRDIAVHQAQSGAEGVARLRGEAEKFDCVFLDYSLTDMDGIAFLREVYDKDAGQGPAPIVMLTGQGSESVMIDALHWGAQDYLVKNFLSTDMLYIALSKAIETFGLRQGRRLAEEQLRQSQKMEAVGQLTSGVAHDFNNLLTVILGNTRLLQRKLTEAGALPADEAEAFVKKVQAIESAARKGADLVQRLMIFTRQRPLEQKETGVNERIGEIYELLKRTLGERIEIRTILSPELWQVRIDSVQLENALINLAINARDAMPNGGHLTVETSNVILDEEYVSRYGGLTPGGYVLIAVSDTGGGIPKALVRRIFDPFFTTKQPGEGTGLGLSMVYGFIRQSGGHIHVYSEEGRGSVFRIYLPRYDGDQVAAAADAEPVPTGSETILVVDDDEEVRSITKTMLEKLGYCVLAASDARMALEMLRQDASGVDLLFTDIIMPGGMSGFDLVRKAQEYYPGLKSLYTSGYTEKTLPDYQLRVGQDLLAKPYRKETLAKKVREILDNGGRSP
jgi:signal transduction histidine kinase